MTLFSLEDIIALLLCWIRMHAFCSIFGSLLQPSVDARGHPVSQLCRIIRSDEENTSYLCGQFYSSDDFLGKRLKQIQHLCVRAPLQSDNCEEWRRLPNICICVFLWVSITAVAWSHLQNS